MLVLKITPSYSDERGEILDVLRNEKVDYTTIITTKAGAVRGNHFHKLTFQWLYVLEGRLRVRAQEGSKPIEEAILERGDLLVNTPLEAHAFEALQDSIMLVLTRGPRGGENYQSDTFKLDHPLIP